MEHGPHLQAEDQEAPKESGTRAGGRCISLDEAVGKEIVKMAVIKFSVRDVSC